MRCYGEDGISVQGLGVAPVPSLCLVSGSTGWTGGVEGTKGGAPSAPAPP